MRGRGACSTACLWLLARGAAGEAGILEPLLDRARARVPAAGPGLCGPGKGPNVFLLRTARAEPSLVALEAVVLESILFNHPLARIFILALSALDAVPFDAYLREGYCVIALQLQLGWLYTAIHAAEPGFSEDSFLALASNRASMPFLVNVALLALQLVYGGISLAMDGILLNPFDTMLPAVLALRHTAVFVERLLPPEQAPMPEALQQEDFELSWNPRSHTDRADGKTLLCGDSMCPRAIPAGCPLAQTLLVRLLAAFFQDGTPPRADLVATRVYSEYVRSRRPRDVLEQSLQQPGGQQECEAFLLPGWVIVEPHFPDGWRYYGHRGQDQEVDDRAQFHSQLYVARGHHESSDWSLVRSLKLWLPLDYGPPSARNVMPRSVIDLARQFLGLRIAPYTVGPLLFGLPPPKSGAPDSHSWHTPAAVFDALDNSMAESLGVGVRPVLPKEVALPGLMGGFRTFRDVRVVGRGSCPPPSVPRVRAVLRLRRAADAPARPKPPFECRPAARPETGFAPDSPLASSACTAALAASGGEQFELAGPPAVVNAALSLLAFRPVPGLGRAPPPRGAPPPADLDHRLSAEELAQHYADLVLDLSEACAETPPGEVTSGADALREVPGPATATAEVEALLDDVEDHVTVVAHSASRCELLERLARSFRSLYPRLPVMLTCECPEGGCTTPAGRPHPTIPATTVVDVPYDFGLSRGKRLLVEWAATEFVLVLDDDFVRSPLSCLECMVLHMRSRLHALPLPFDLLGFPILEDERNFGAFRGKLRATSGRLFLEPSASEATVDGCTRVGIHPMAFLARTVRFRGFKFQDQLRVGEHEQFFYANQYLGLHAAVCFDSTFPHFRVQMSAGYKQRRERMQELMTREFEKIGFPSVMYLLHKYDAYSGADHAEFIQQDVPPWSISDDTCGPQPDPPADFCMFFAAVFSTPDEQGEYFRHLLRGGAPSAWLPRLSTMATTRWAFFVEENSPSGPAIAAEDEEYGDIVVMPSAPSRPARGTAERSPSTPHAEQLQFVLFFLRNFQFRWLLVAQQDVFVHVEPLLAALLAEDPPQRVAVGGWRAPPDWPSSAGPVAPWLPPQLFALTHDVKHLLSSPRVTRWLRTDLEGGDAGEALNAWLAPLELRRGHLGGVHVGWGGAEAVCPGGGTAMVAVLHPVTAQELQLLSDAAAMHGSPCAAWNATPIPAAAGL